MYTPAAVPICYFQAFVLSLKTNSFGCSFKNLVKVFNNFLLIFKIFRTPIRTAAFVIGVGLVRMRFQTMTGKRRVNIATLDRERGHSGYRK